MIRSPRPSFPAPSEPSVRRLGVGSASGNERPLRAQLVVALVTLLVLVAVPLYLWRRPGGNDVAGSASVSAGSSSALTSNAPPPGPDAGVPPDRLRLGPPQRVRCSASSRGKAKDGQFCDQLPFFEDALKRAIRDNVDCAPRSKTDGTINYVLQIDFSKQRLHIFPGASGQWKGTLARRATQCVQRSLPSPQWSNIQHQDNHYQIAILATYPGRNSVTPAASGSASLFD